MMTNLTSNMGCDEMEIYDLLRTMPEKYFSVLEVSYRLGKRRKADKNGLWAASILHRMHLEGWLEANMFGEYRAKENGGHTTSFYQALGKPGIDLGDTTIITLEDVS